MSPSPHGAWPSALPTPPHQMARVAQEASRPSSLSFPSSSSSPLPHILVSQELPWPSQVCPSLLLWIRLSSTRSTPACSLPGSLDECV